MGSSFFRSDKSALWLTGVRLGTPEMNRKIERDGALRFASQMHNLRQIQQLPALYVCALRFEFEEGSARGANLDHRGFVAVVW